MFINMTMPFVLTALALNAPLSVAEETIARDCLDRGASEAECSCGVTEARKVMTPAEIEMVAAIVPAMSSAVDTGTALTMIPDALEKAGIAPDQFAPVMMKALQFGQIVEDQCADAGIAPDPDGATGDEAAPGRGVPD